MEHMGCEGDLPSVLVFGDPAWSPTLVGLAAGTLAEAYQRTVCLWGREGTGVLKGSCRTDGTVNIIDLFTANKEVLLYYGGHASAGGFAVDDTRIHSLSESFNTAYQALACNSQPKPFVEPEVNIPLAFARRDTYTEIVRLAPFGIGNPKPVFIFGSVEIVSFRMFGKDNNHFEVMIQDASSGVRKATRFFASEHSFTRMPIIGGKADILATIEENNFNGRRSIELRIVDIM